LQQAYDAHIFRLIPDANNFYSLKLQAGNKNWDQLINIAQDKWKEFFPGNPFEYFFLDEHFGEQYKADRQFGTTFGLFAIMAIIVACLGLLGLASFVTTQRTKEIGIRKIAGARIFNILFLLTRDFIRPVIVSFVIALPVTYYILHKWLSNYAFRAPISVWIFVLPAILILLIALLTLSTQTIKAASANPVNSLRTE
jgi:putative ABC transport system permease protein